MYFYDNCAETVCSIATGLSRTIPSNTFCLIHCTKSALLSNPGHNLRREKQLIVLRRLIEQNKEILSLDCIVLTPFHESLEL